MDEKLYLDPIPEPGFLADDLTEFGSSDFVWTMQPVDWSLWGRRKKWPAMIRARKFKKGAYRGQ